MRKLLICGLMSLFCLGVCIIADFPQTSDAVIELMDFGYDKSRYQALEDAIEKYNNMKRSGHTFSLHVNHYVDSSWDWDDYVKDFNRRNRDKEIDLFMINSDYLSELVNAESIACMDDIISSGDFMYEYLTTASSQYAVSGALLGAFGRDRCAYRLFEP